jgi:hypothetical protein
MTMDLIRTIVGMGLPVLGQALGGPLGGMVAGMVAKALGAPSTASTDILDKLQSMEPSEAVQKLKSAEAEYVATVEAEAQVAGIATHEVGETQRAELTAAVQFAQLGKWGTFVLFMQTSWRPIMAYQTIIEFTMMNVVAVHELWTGDLQTLDKMQMMSTFLIWYFGIKLSLLGVYSVGHTVEKVSGADTMPSAAPPWLETLIRAIKGVKK